jgi:hypothetical protein
MIFDKETRVERGHLEKNDEDNIKTYIGERDNID